MSAPCDVHRFLDNRLLAGISADVLAPVLALIEEDVVEPGVVIFEEGDAGEEMFLIAEGSVKISKRGRGGLQESLAHLSADDFFGDMALVDNGRRSAQASADSRTVLGRMKRAAWSRLLQAAPEAVLTNFTRTITGRLRANNQKFIEEMLRNERLSLLGATVSSIVHDINNPIACILAACELLQRDAHTDLAREMTGIILKSVERMRGMAQEMLDFARGTTNLSRQEVSSRDLVADLEAQEFPRCIESGISVRAEVRWEGVLTIDFQRIQRLLGNLVKNAREAMPNGGELRFVLDQQDKSIVFELSDTGCGIPTEMLPRIWEPFVTFGKARGTGLGLAISKAVVEAHGGSISVRSEVGRGTTFEVRLPVA